jgi:lysozyme
MQSGIDVSHFQSQIDWRKVQRVGVSFAFVKASEGLSVLDPMFHPNWEAAREQGIFRGAYHFFRPQLDPQQQADFFLRQLDDDPGELPPALDLEVIGNVDPDEVIRRANRWLKIVGKELKCKPVIYTGSAFFRTTLNNSTAFASHPLWIAHYTIGPKPMVPKAWPQWTFWQFSQQGKVVGINGNVDLNAFNGNMPDLEALCVRKLPPMKIGTSA